MDEIWDQLKANKVVAVVRRLPESIYADVIRALVAGGIQSIEVTMDAPTAPSLINQVVRDYGQDVHVGAGTVFTKNQAQNAVEAGAKFLVCPHLDLSLLEEAQRLGVPLVPGVMTPTEIHTAVLNGARAVKVFPASAVGPGFIKDILGPFSGLSMMVTGGLTISNFPSFLQAGADVVGLGSFLFPRDNLADKNWQAIEDRARQIMDIVRAL